MLIPAEYWRQPVNDAAYQGFDSNLIYVDRRGGAPSSGLVEVSATNLILTALPNSRPTLNLLTTPLARIRMEMDVRIVNNGTGTVPFRIGVWSPNTGSGQFLQFGPPPSNPITFEKIVEGVVAPNLLGGRIANSDVLGSYVQGVSYRTTISLDKLAGIMRFRVAGGESPPSGHRMLRIVGRGSPEYSAHVLSDWVHVKGGTFYSFSGAVKHVSGFGTYGFVVEWVNRNQQRVGISEEWHDIAELHDWTTKKFEAIAPPDATSARLRLGTARGVEVLFADLFFAAGSEAKDNLLLNGDLADGERGWKRDTANPIPPEVLQASYVSYEKSTTTADAAELFRELRLSITASGFSESDVSTVMLSNYQLTLPHQRWLVAKVEDSRVKAIFLTLLVCALLVSTGVVIAFMRREILNARGLTLTIEKFNQAVKSYSLKMLVVAIAVGLYFVSNAMLFNAGSLNYDLKSATVWLYVIPRYGLSALYHLAAVVGPADSWGGVPFQEAAFPYGPILAGIFLIVSWFHKLLFGLPEPFSQDVFALAFTVKAATLLFTIADAGLIFLILRAYQISLRKCLLGTSMFLFNPAVIFVGSVWGQTQSISLFFLLASLWLAALNRHVGAWVAVALATLTRQQLLVPSLLLGVYLLRKFPAKQNIEGIAWGVLVPFILTAPLALSLSPSLPVDLYRNAFDLHILGEDSARSTLLSWSALSIWPLVTQRIAGQAGLGRIFYPGKEPLIGNLTYWHVGNLLFFTVVLMSILALIFMPRSGRTENRHIPIITLGTLGLFLLKPGFAAFHLITALAIMIVGGSIFGRSGHYLAVAVLTGTTLIAMYGVAGVWMTAHPWWNVGLFSPDHPITQLFIRLFTTDWFITLGSISNLAVLGWLALVAFGLSRQRSSVAELGGNGSP